MLSLPRIFFILILIFSGSYLFSKPKSKESSYYVALGGFSAHSIDVLIAAGYGGSLNYGLERKEDYQVMSVELGAEYPVTSKFNRYTLSTNLFLNYSPSQEKLYLLENTSVASGENMQITNDNFNFGAGFIVRKNLEKITSSFLFGLGLGLNINVIHMFSIDGLSQSAALAGYSDIPLYNPYTYLTLGFEFPMFYKSGRGNIFYRYSLVPNEIVRTKHLIAINNSAYDYTTSPFAHLKTSSDWHNLMVSFIHTL